MESIDEQQIKGVNLNNQREFIKGLLDEYFDGKYDKSFLQDKFVQNIDFEKIKTNLLQITELQNQNLFTNKNLSQTEMEENIQLLQQSTIKQFADFVDKSFPMVSFSLRVNTPRLNEKEYQQIFDALDKIITQLLEKMQPQRLLKSEVNKQLNTPYQLGKYLSINNK